MHISPFTFDPLMPDPVTLADRLAGDALKARIAPEPIEKEVPAAPPAPTFSEDELAAAKLDAYDEGFAAGKEEGRREVDHAAQLLQQQINGVLDTVNSQLRQLMLQHQEFLSRKQPELGSLILSCAGRLALEALRRDPVADIATMVEECLSTLLGKPDVVITVHPRLQSPLAEMFGRRAKVAVSEKLAPGDCRITWDKGESVREIDRIWSEIETVIERHFSMSTVQMASLPEEAQQEQELSLSAAESQMQAEPDENPTDTLPYDMITTDGDDNG